MRGILRRSALTILLICGFSEASTGTADALVLCRRPFSSAARLGPAAYAVLAGPWAASGNPAALAGGISASGGTAALESSTAGAAAALSAGGGIMVGLSLQWLGHGGIQGRDEQGLPVGEYSWSSGCLSAALAADVAPSLKAGVSFGPVWESAGDEGATGLTSSAGILWNASPSIDVGLALENFGSAPDWSGVQKNMPVEISLGAAWKPSGMISIIGGGSLGFHTSSRLSAAAEVRSGSVSLSGGWELVPDDPEASGPFAGIGYIYESSGIYRVDVAVTRDEFGWPVLAGLSAGF